MSRWRTEGGAKRDQRLCRSAHPKLVHSSFGNLLALIMASVIRTPEERSTPPQHQRQGHRRTAHYADSSYTPSPPVLQLFGRGKRRRPDCTEGGPHALHDATLSVRRFVSSHLSEGLHNGALTTP